MPNRVLETTLTGRNLLSPMLAKASADVVAFNSTVARANGEAGAAASVSAARQEGAAAKIAASNVKASTSASASAQQQMRAHAKAAESATLSARLQETANRSLAASNGLLGTSLTPITAGLGATALALGYAGYRGMEFGTAMSQVQAASQASAADMRLFRDAAVDAGAKTKYSAVEAAGGITEMSKAGVSARDILGGGLTGALNLAAAGQISVAEAAETGATALSVFNLNGNKMSHVADLLAAGAGKAQGSVGDMAAALNQSALVANQAGLSIEDTAGALAMFASNGLLGSDAGTSFKTMLQALTPNSKQAAEAMAAIGFSAYDAQGNFVGLQGVAAQLKTGLAGLTEEQRNTTLETIFGSDAVRAASVLYKEGAQGVAEWAGNVNDAGYAQRQAAQLTDNLRGDLEKLGGAFDSTMTTIGSGAQGPLRAAVQALTAVVNAGGDVIEFFTNLPGPIQAGLVALTAVHVLGGPLTTTIKGIGFAVDVMGASFKNAGGAAGILKGGASGLLGVFGGPWGLAITGVTVGLSALVSLLGSSGDSSDDAAVSANNLTSALQATKGAIDDTVRAAAAADLEDAGLLKWADEWGIKSSDLVDAATGVDGALARVREGALQYAVAQREAAAADDEHGKVMAGTISAHSGAALASEAQYKALLQLVGLTEDDVAAEQRKQEATNGTTDAMAATTAQTEEAAKAQEDWLKTVSTALQGFSEPLDTYKGLLDEKTEADRESAEKQAAASKSSSDSWKDFVTDVSVSLDEYAAKLEEQATNQENWRTNITKVTARGGLEVGQILLAMGEEGAQITADMADAGTADFERLKAALIANAQAGGAGAAAALDRNMKIAARVSAAGAKDTVVGIAKELNVGVDEVAAIASKYGIALASGINPLLGALGRDQLSIARIKAGRNSLGGYWDGGYTGDGDKYEPKGVVHGGEFVFTKEQTSKAGVEQLSALAGMLSGYSGGGFVSTASVPRPSSTAPYRSPISTAGDATMAKEYADVTAWLKANQEPAYTGGGSASASSAELVKFGRWLQSQGARVSEHPAFGGVTMGAHVAGSKHYRNAAIDVNTRAGTSALEQGELDPLMAAARAAGFQVIWRDAGHFNHGHVAARKSGGPVWPGQDFLVGEEGPELVRMTGTGTVIPAGRTAAMVAPAAMPGYGMGGGGQGGSTVVKVAAPDLRGLTIQGRMTVDGNGIATIAGRVVDQKLDEIHDTIHYAGG